MFLVLPLAFTTAPFTAYASENSISPAETLALGPTSTATAGITPREAGPLAVEDSATGSLNINGLVYSESALELFWDRQPPPVVNYRVQGTDGTDEITEGTSFFREGIASNTSTQFTVTALSEDGSETVTESIELTTQSNDDTGTTIQNLRGEVYSSSALEIFWDAENAPVDVTFNVRRNGDLVTTTDGRSFFDAGLAAGTAFTYTVETVGANDAVSVSLTTDGGVNISSGDLNLNSVVYSSSALELFWDRVANATTYRIERDSVVLDERDALSFFEDGLSAGTTFSYSVSAISSDGSVISSETITVATTGVVDGIAQIEENLQPGNCPTVGNLASIELAAGQCQLGGELLEDGTLSADIEWFLEGGLTVGSESISASLSIDAGTRIRGDNEGANDYLLVYPGSSLFANGTSSNPVQFLSDDDNVDGSGEWGGVFIRGFIGTDNEGAQQGENLLDYVVIGEAGATTTVTVGGNQTTYSDNLVINGVDDTTRLSFVQSHNSARDGIHILNSTARMSWILVTGAERDGIWYRDFSGLIKDLMVIHNRDADGSSGRAGIYASETIEGNSNPRIVNASLIGRDSTSESAGDNDNEFGILFADNTDQIRLANVLIANFRYGCYEVDDGADLSEIDLTLPGPNYIDGVHCANEAGANGNFGVVRDDATGFGPGVVASNNSNGDGIVYYNGAGGALPAANTDFSAPAGGINFTGELVDRTQNFTAGWYLNNLRGIGNGLLGNSEFLNGFLDGDTNRDGVVDGADTNSPFIIADNAFNQDVAADTFGYDLTHIGAVRGGAVTNTQFDNWTVDTGPDDSFTVQVNPANL